MTRWRHSWPVVGLAIVVPSGGFMSVFMLRIYRLLVRMVGTDAASDVTQQVFLQVFRKMEQFSGQGRFDGWLYRLAVNEAYQHLRREGRRRHQSLVFEPMDESVRGGESG